MEQAFERIFQVDAVLFFLAFAGVGLILRLIIGGIKGENGGTIVAAGVETFALTLLGGFLARMFISIVLGSANDSPDVGTLVGWVFFVIPGLIDGVIRLFGGPQVLTTTEALLWFAAVVGSFTGMMAGIWRIYKFSGNGTGVPAFILDVTWGLAGSTVAVLLHIINFAWAQHADEPDDRRRNNHRYRKGFALKPSYAFTQGQVMSNCISGGNPSIGLWRHEDTHIWQNRLFGPFFTSTYLGWFLIMFIFGIIIGWIKLGFGIQSAVQGVTDISYLSNPWEVWAYKVGEGLGESPRVNFGQVVIPDLPAVILAIIYIIAVLALTIAIIVGVW
jgi:hypothetical protein